MFTNTTFSFEICFYEYKLSVDLKKIKSISIKTNENYTRSVNFPKKLSVLHQHITEYIITK